MGRPDPKDPQDPTGPDLPHGTPEPVEPLERSRDVDRLLTFVDAVVAIAITLLVLPLVDVAGQLDGGSVATLLREHVAQLLAFAISFYVIASLWFDQHRALRPVVRAERGITALLMLWTFTVVVLPFPTSLVAQAGSQTTTKVFYLGTMTLSSALLTLICRQVSRHPDVRDAQTPPDPAHPAASTAIYVVTLVVAVAVPGASYWPLVLLRLAGPAARWWRRRHPAPVG